MYRLKVLLPVAVLGLLAALLGPSACLVPSYSIEIQDMGPGPVSQGTGGGCVCTAPSLFQSNGSVDLNLSTLNPEACWGGILVFHNNLSTITGTSPVSGDPNPTASRNDFTLTAVQFTYIKASDGSTYSPTETVPMSGFAAAGGNAFLCMDVCSPNAAKKLVGEQNVPLDVVVQMQLVGNLTSGEAVKSNPFGFPITYVRDSATGPGSGTCTAPLVQVEIPPPSCVAFIGQDGSGFLCGLPNNG